MIGGGELYDVFSLDNVSIDNFKLKNVRSPALMQESGAKISISHGRPDSQGNGSVNAQWGWGGANCTMNKVKKALWVVTSDEENTSGLSDLNICAAWL